MIVQWVRKYMCTKQSDLKSEMLEPYVRGMKYDHSDLSAREYRLSSILAKTPNIIEEVQNIIGYWSFKRESYDGIYLVEEGGEWLLFEQERGSVSEEHSFKSYSDAVAWAFMNNWL